jgi:hypothetical protein
MCQDVMDSGSNALFEFKLNFFPYGFEDKCWLSEILRWRRCKKLLEHSRIECCCTVSVLEVSLAAFIEDLLEISLTCNTLHSLQPKPPAGIGWTVNVRIPVVYMAQGVMILMRANPLQGPLEVGPENLDWWYLGPKKSRFSGPTPSSSQIKGTEAWDGFCA